jgi:acyl carrier protein
MVEIGIIIEASLEGRFIDEDIDDSLTYISFIVEIEEEFNISIPDEYLQADIIETYDDVAEMIQQLL